MHRERSPHGWRRHGNTPGNPATAARCGARTRAGTPCRAPALRAKLRCRMHGGRSCGPPTLDGLARVRAARTQHGRYGAVERRFRRWLRQYVTNGYRSARAMPDQRARAHFLMRAGEPIPAALLAAMRQEACEEVARQDAQRLKAVASRHGAAGSGFGLLRANPSMMGGRVCQA
jgi:hypothetical protein